MCLLSEHVLLLPVFSILGLSMGSKTNLTFDQGWRNVRGNFERYQKLQDFFETETDVLVGPISETGFCHWQN